jgi:hypothetical protein
MKPLSSGFGFMIIPALILLRIVEHVSLTVGSSAKGVIRGSNLNEHSMPE